MNANNRDAAYACALILKDKKILLGRRAHFRAAYPECWDVIGGKIEPGESAEQALMRELKEEVAICPSNPRYFDVIQDANSSADVAPTYHFFIVDAWQGGDPVINNHEHSHLEWFTLQQACDLSNLAVDEYRALFKSCLA